MYLSGIIASPNAVTFFLSYLFPNTGRGNFTYTREELMLFTWQTDIGRDIEKEEIGLAVDTGNHAVYDVQIPPRPPPALFEDGYATAMDGGE